MSACSASDSTPPPAASSSPSGSSATYVALGDSYSAGPLIPTTDVAGGCFRSDHDYPSLLAAALRVRLVDRTCSGADTRSFTHAQYADVPPQMSALDARTSLVTVGLGGNDSSVFGLLTGRCPALRSQDPTGSPCADAMKAGGTDALLRDLAKTQRNLTNVLDQVHRLAPHAKVLAVGYPQIVSADHVCSRLPLAPGDYAYVEKINRALTEAVQGAARASGATYVDLWKLSQGHDICSADPWINGSVNQQHKAPAYHPFAAEHVAVAGLIRSMLAGS